VLAATADAMPLDDAAADSIVCARAFHWFATGEAPAEIHRDPAGAGVVSCSPRLGLARAIIQRLMPSNRPTPLSAAPPRPASMPAAAARAPAAGAGSPAAAAASSPSLPQLWRPIVAMTLVVVASNWLVQYPINAWLTWGAFVYPVAFLVTELTNRSVGTDAARRVAWTGFAAAVLVSAIVAPWRIAVASGAAFITSQLADVRIFNRWRAQS